MTSSSEDSCRTRRGLASVAAASASLDRQSLGGQNPMYFGSSVIQVKDSGPKPNCRRSADSPRSREILASTWISTPGTGAWSPANSRNSPIYRSSSTAVRYESRSSTPESNAIPSSRSWSTVRSKRATVQLHPLGQRFCASSCFIDCTCGNDTLIISHAIFAQPCSVRTSGLRFPPDQRTLNG